MNNHIEESFVSLDLALEWIDDLFLLFVHLVYLSYVVNFLTISMAFEV